MDYLNICDLMWIFMDIISKIEELNFVGNDVMILIIDMLSMFVNCVLDE